MDVDRKWQIFLTLLIIIALGVLSLVLKADNVKFTFGIFPPKIELELNYPMADDEDDYTR